MKRPKGIAGPRLQAIWLGPYFISKQVGENSFELLIGKEEVAVHASQLKLCVEVGDTLELDSCGSVVKPVPAFSLFSATPVATPRESAMEEAAIPQV